LYQLLLVEDTEEYQKLIARSVGAHAVTICPTVREALLALKQNSFDLILLDINLPDQNGYNLLTELQADTTLVKIPVLCLTGRSEITDKITAFSLGADDYITKPFDPLELRARVEAKLQKTKRASDGDPIVQIGDIRIDRARHRVSVQPKGTQNKTREVDLTQTEFKLLCCLARRPDQVYSRDQLLVAAWGEDAKVTDRVVDVHLCSLRKKLGKDLHLVQAVAGVGYRLLSAQITKRAV
jgi:DNA-binding response OmpR family regulator